MTNMTYPFGREKGKPLSEVPNKSLEFLIQRCRENTNPQYADKNRQTIQVCEQILKQRAGVPAAPTKAAVAPSNAVSTGSGAPAKTPVPVDIASALANITLAVRRIETILAQQIVPVINPQKISTLNTPEEVNERLAELSRQQNEEDTPF